MAVPTPMSYGGGPAIIPFIPWGKPRPGDLRYPRGYIDNEFTYARWYNDCAKKCSRNFDAWYNLHYPIYNGVDIGLEPSPPEVPWTGAGGAIEYNRQLALYNAALAAYNRERPAFEAENQKQQDIHDSCIDRCRFAYALGVPAL